MKPIHRALMLTVSKILFAIYIILLAYFLFFSERYGRTLGSEEYRFNLKLFQEVRRFITYRKAIGLESFVVNIFGNILAFAPFGFGLPIISPNSRKLWKIVLLSLEFSLTIELIQLLFRVGIFDVDDLFMNTLGGLVGYICFQICYKIYRTIQNIC